MTFFEILCAILAALLGLVLCPRLMVLACVGFYIWSEIEERR